jgi:hypothetical protein
LLDSHPQIDCYGEVLNLKDVTERSYPKYVRDRQYGALLHRARRGKLLDEYLDQLLLSDSEKASGFKLMYSMTSWYPYQFPMVMPSIERRSLAVIHLTRSNVFRTHLSRVTARARKVWHTEEAQGPKSAVVMPAEQLQRTLQKITDQDAVWRKKLARLNPLSITYESLVEDFDSVSAAILGFLEVDESVGLQSPLRKINTDNLRQVIKNYDDVKGALAGSKFESLLGIES